MTLDLTEAEYLELRVAALSRIDLLNRVLKDPDWTVDVEDKHRADLDAIISASAKLRTAYFASLEVA